MKYTKIEVEGMELVLQFNKDTNTVDIISVKNGEIGDVECPISGNVDNIYGNALYVGGDIIAGIGGSIIGRDNDHVPPLPMVIDDQVYVVGSIGQIITIDGNDEDKDEFLAGWKEHLKQENKEHFPKKPTIVHVKENEVITEMEKKLEQLKEEDLQKRLKQASKAKVKRVTGKELEEIIKNSKAKIRYTVV